MNYYINSIKALFNPPRARTIAERELEEVERSILRQRDIVEMQTQMLAYYQNKLKRLQKYVAE